MYTHIHVKQFFEQHKHMVSHYVVAQTNLRPADLSEAGIASMADKAKLSLNITLNHFADMINPETGNRRARDKTLGYRPLSLVTIEHLSPHLTYSKTIHFNIALGNIDPRFDLCDVDEIFRHCWVDKAGQVDDVLTSRFDGRSNLFTYMLKEAEWKQDITSTSLSTWDAGNCHIPTSPVFADIG